MIVTGTDAVQLLIQERFVKDAASAIRSDNLLDYWALAHILGMLSLGAALQSLGVFEEQPFRPDSKPQPFQNGYVFYR